METTLVRRAVSLLDDAQSLGFDRAELLAATELREEMLQSCEDRIPLISFFDLLTAALVRSDDPAIGIRLGGMTEVRDWGIVGYLLQFSGTLEGALERLVEFAPIVSSNASLTTRLESDRLVLSGQPNPLSGMSTEFFDYVLAGVVRVARLISGEDLDPIEVGSPGRRPSNLEHHRRYFSCPMKFGTEEAQVAFPLHALRRPLLRRDEGFARELTSLAERQLSSLKAQEGFLGRVREVTWDLLNDGRPPIDKVASRLAMSPRSLQRRLKAEGTSYSGLLDDMRRTMAFTMLADPHLAIYEISVLLGYSEPSAFHRSFKRWVGKTPEEYRRDKG